MRADAKADDVLNRAKPRERGRKVGPLLVIRVLRRSPDVRAHEYFGRVGKRGEDYAQRPLFFTGEEGEYRRSVPSIFFGPNSQGESCSLYAATAPKRKNSTDRFFQR